MEVKIYPPPAIADGIWAKQWYELEILQTTFNLNAKVHEYKIKDKNKFRMQSYEHCESSISFKGVLTASSGIPGSTLETKKDNLIEAASSWWLIGDQVIQANCAQIYWRGWTQYMMIERLAIEKTAGEVENYDYELVVHIHEGA